MQEYVEEMDKIKAVEEGKLDTNKSKKPTNQICLFPWLQ